MLEKTDQSNEPAFVPSLHKTRIMRLFLPHMVSYLNPEAQMKKLYRYWASNHLYQFTYLALGKGIVSDIGRDWLLSKGIKRDYEKTKKYGSSKWSPWISWET
jgi:folate-dependent tRNA-U54 methylase TrmFO/GidA